MSRRSECRIQISSGFFLLAAWFGVVNGWGLLAVVLGVLQLAVVSSVRKKNGHLKLGGRQFAFAFGSFADAG